VTSLQQKLLSVDDKPDIDDVFAKNRKLMSLIDKYKSELNEAHHEIQELRSRLLNTADAKVTSLLELEHSRLFLACSVSYLLELFKVF